MTFWGEVFWYIIGAGLIAYAISGGADLGAGFWSVLASGPRRDAQRQAVISEIAPIWEANHVWLIFVIVVMFSAFSRAFAAISIALHVPIALALVGIVIRGAAYSFCSYGIQSERTRTRWGNAFAWASGITPILLGMIVGALSDGSIELREGIVQSGFFSGWTTGFALIVGGLTASLFAMLSAAYLSADTEGELSRDFARRALWAQGFAAAFAALAALVARSRAPAFFQNLVGSSWSLPIQAATAAFAIATIVLLWQGHTRWARWTAPAQVASVVLGWGLAMDGHFILPALPAARAIENPAVLPAFAAALAAGTALLGPSLWYLYRVFKTR